MTDMTERQVLAALKKTPRDWRLKRGKIRRSDPVHFCPALVVASTERVSAKMFWNVVHAADNDPEHDPKLRAKLLRACGLRP